MRRISWHEPWGRMSHDGGVTGSGATSGRVGVGICVLGEQYRGCRGRRRRRQRPAGDHSGRTRAMAAGANSAGRPWQQCMTGRSEWCGGEPLMIDSGRLSLAGVWVGPTAAEGRGKDPYSAETRAASTRADHGTNTAAACEPVSTRDSANSLRGVDHFGGRGSTGAQARHCLCALRRLWRPCLSEVVTFDYKCRVFYHRS